MNRVDIYRLEHKSLHDFVASVPFTGRVLDYGCGAMPYQKIIAGKAEYVPWDREYLPGKPEGETIGRDDVLERRQWNWILCTQVIQYVPHPYRLLRFFREAILPGGGLAITGPGCWHEEEPAYHQSFTKTGIAQLLKAAGFEVERVEDRASFDLGGFRISLGWAAVGRT